MSSGSRTAICMVIPRWYQLGIRAGRDELLSDSNLTARPGLSVEARVLHVRQVLLVVVLCVRERGQARKNPAPRGELGGSCEPSPAVGFAIRPHSHAP